MNVTANKKMSSIVVVTNAIITLLKMTTKSIQ